MGQDESSLSYAGPPATLTERSLAAVAEYIKSGRSKRIVVLTGAGISTAAGIPDFRSPGTGLYANLARLNLPYAEAVFDISYFREHPEPFYVLANELYPGKFHPTVSHAFIALLARKGLLQMLFTQNIDCLERVAGVPSDKIIEAHGSFATQRCIECKEEYPEDKMKEHVFGGKVPHCDKEGCKGLVKPDIVFFGEPLPKAFDNNTYQVAMADLVLVVGTSLSVYPFAALPGIAQEGKPRVLFNMERVGQLGTRSDDVIELGDCDAGIRKFADELGWRDELEKMWRQIVGDVEAERQLNGRKKDEVQDEMERLAAEVEAVAIDDDKNDTRDTNVQQPDERQDVPSESESTTHHKDPIVPEQTKDEADKEEPASTTAPPTTTAITDEPNKSTEEPKSEIPAVEAAKIESTVPEPLKPEAPREEPTQDTATEGASKEEK
ncbi:DHS-like NAD/FAD-binding domain-containing protein [Fusarium tricinctum]|uniref:DHS-like NAD/FAD-binding domain-containing protein n=2 Tax=Fusarium tricinctum species complex TaxID=679429 RepID=A0A8K0RNU3_9HYPO|nr:DHS-like NAD/FAD-binding domain-containing protein [Fusarium tricinctum]